MGYGQSKAAFLGAQGNTNSFALYFTAEDLSSNPVYLERAVEQLDVLDNALLADVLAKEDMIDAFVQGGHALWLMEKLEGMEPEQFTQVLSAPDAVWSLLDPVQKTLSAEQSAVVAVWLVGKIDALNDAQTARIFANEDVTWAFLGVDQLLERSGLEKNSYHFWCNGKVEVIEAGKSAGADSEPGVQPAL